MSIVSMLDETELSMIIMTDDRKKKKNPRDQIMKKENTQWNCMNYADFD